MMLNSTSYKPQERILGMGKRIRRIFTPAQKATAVVRHVQDGVLVSDLCDELGIHPNQYYEWQKQALSNLEVTFEKRDSERKKLEKALAATRAKLARKDWAIAELLEEHIALKKNGGVT